MVIATSVGDSYIRTHHHYKLGNSRKMKCKTCKNEIKGQTNKVFCSTKCRVYAGRNKRQELDQSVTQSVTQTPQSVTDSVTNVTLSDQSVTKPVTLSSEPNWTKWAPIIKRLFEDKDKILKYGTTGEAVFYLGNYKIVVK